eukprot:TRINITY_DN2898_c1_g2_i1.p1 TRINITY_DN2898_c1_g2~~TRINITY_DN2898_c1_g2_i1.p1  ORF type:complete len:500 (+),score=138.45 TRINITY_DN2898_c1_g2_i1:59-1558(+)
MTPLSDTVGDITSPENWAAYLAASVAAEGLENVPEQQQQQQEGDASQTVSVSSGSSGMDKYENDLLREENRKLAEELRQLRMQVNTSPTANTISQPTTPTTPTLVATAIPPTLQDDVDSDDDTDSPVEEPIPSAPAVSSPAWVFGNESMSKPEFIADAIWNAFITNCTIRGLRPSQIPYLDNQTLLALGINSLEGCMVVRESQVMQQQLQLPSLADQQLQQQLMTPLVATEPVFFPGELSQVVLLEDPGKGEWINVLITAVDNATRTCDILVLPTPGAGSRFARQNRKGISMKYLRKLFIPQQMPQMPQPVIQPTLVAPTPAAAATTGLMPPVMPVASGIPISKKVMLRFRYGRVGTCECSLGLPIGSHVIVAMGREGRHQDLGVIIKFMGSGGDGRRVVRSATPTEIASWNNLAASDSEAKDYMTDLVEKNDVPIVINAAEWQFEMKTLTFHYTSLVPHPDFRKVLTTAYRKFHCRIWMNNCKPSEGKPGEPLNVSVE